MWMAVRCLMLLRDEPKFISEPKRCRWSVLAEWCKLVIFDEIFFKFFTSTVLNSDQGCELGFGASVSDKTESGRLQPVDSLHAKAMRPL